MLHFITLNVWTIKPGLFNVTEVAYKMISNMISYSNDFKRSTMISKKDRCKKNNQPIKISRLENSVYYFLDYVFIVEEEDSFRLLVIHRGKVLTDKLYPTLRGARIAFRHIYEGKAWSKDLKARWSNFYQPDKRWLNSKLKTK
jgi:hypothetical protein